MIEGEGGPKPGVALAAPVTLAELARLHGGWVDEAAREALVHRIAAIELAREGELAPFLAYEHVATARATRAVLLVDASLANEVPEGRRWVHPHATFALAGLLEAVGDLSDLPRKREAFVGEGAKVAETACIGPGAVVLDGAVVGEHCIIEPNAVVYARVWLGARVRIGAGAVVGRPGFGWAFGPDGAVRRMPQLGGVVVEDDVEIGPLCTIDAGTLGPTRIERGVKLDAQVHVGHNVVLGAGTIVAAQSGFAGSSRVGAKVLVGGQVGVADHVTIGPGARIAAKSGVIGDIAGGVTVAGYPAVERMRWLRGMARLLKKR